MAIFYTNWITGNDTTGDGSFANPYKSIWKASSMVAANNDEVRVAGSGWTDLPGTLTFAQNNATITTSQDLTSLFPELTATAGNGKVVITIDDEWGIGKSVFTVVAVNAFSLTLATVWGGKSGVFNGKRLTTQHYYLTSNPTSPSGQSGYADDINLAVTTLYTGIQITGGWTSATTRDGMTAIVNAGGNNISTQYRFIYAATSTTAQVNAVSTHYYAGFGLINLLAFNRDGTGTNGIAQMGDFWFVRSSAQFSTSNTIMWNKTGETPNFYMYDCSGGSGSRWGGDITTTQNGSNQFNVNIWHTFSTISSGNVSFSGNRNHYVNYHLRGVNSTGSNILGGTGGYFQNGGYSARFTIGNFYFYKSNTTQDLYFLIAGTQAENLIYFKIDTINLPNPGTRDGVYLTTGLSGNAIPVGLSRQWYLGNGTQTLEQMGIGTVGNNGGGTFIPQGMTGGSFLVNTTDGLWRWVLGNGTDVQNILVSESTDYVTGTNALKLKLNEINAGLPNTSTFNRTALAVLPNITTTKTITIKAKAASAGATGSYELSIQGLVSNGFANALNITVLQYLTSSMALTTTYQDFVYTIDPSTWPITTAPNSNIPLNLCYLYFGYQPLSGSFKGDILIDSITLS